MDTTKTADRLIAETALQIQTDEAVLGLTTDKSAATTLPPVLATHDIDAAWGSVKWDDLTPLQDDFNFYMRMRFARNVEQALLRSLSAPTAPSVEQASDVLQIAKVKNALNRICESHKFNVSSMSAHEVHSEAISALREIAAVVSLIESIESASLEKAAEECERVSGGYHPHATDKFACWSDNGKGCAGAIRALKSAAQSAPVASEPVASGKYDGVLKPFLALMEAELHANSGKGDRPGWLSMSREIALLEIYYHLSKLQKAAKDDNAPAIREHAADVANMSMMLVDVCGALPEAK